MTNENIARKLRSHATELARHGDNLYRVRAFRQAAITILSLPHDVNSLLANGGPRALEELPGIGHSLAQTIAGIAADFDPPTAPISSERFPVPAHSQECRS